MLAFQAEATTLLPRADTSHTAKSSKSIVQSTGHTLRGARARVKALFDRRAHAEATIVERYAGHRWTDSTERQLIDEIVNSRF